MSISGNMFRGAVCAGVATAVTVACVWSFQDSTFHAPGVRTEVAAVTSMKIPLAHAVFGRPQPAVLVD